MPGLYGRRAREIEETMRHWGVHTHWCVKDFQNNPLMCQQSVDRNFDVYHRLANELRGELGVAKKDFNAGTFKGFVNVTLSQVSKDQYAAWDVEDSDVWDGLAVYGEKGYKFTLSYSKGNSHWIATHTGQEGCGKNAGYATTAFAPTPYEAARVLLFKVSVVLPDVWSEFQPEGVDAIG